MRPALLRLLKRPSAVYFLGDLISHPLSVEQVDITRRCLKCQFPRAYRGPALRKETASAQSAANPTASQTQPDTHTSCDLPVHAVNPSEEHEQSPTWPPERDFVGSWTLQLEKLDYESDVGHVEDIGLRLVDRPSWQHDFALWEELLRYRQRHYGDAGTHDIWIGLICRAKDVELPVEGERADLFWESFVNIGLEMEPLMEDIAAYAWKLWEKTGKRWPRFHEAVVGGYFERGLPLKAVQWHRQLQDPHLSCPNDVVHILDQALSCKPQHAVESVLDSPATRIRSSRQGLQAFKDICLSTKGHRIYNAVIRGLTKRDRYTDAVLMHEFLVENQDLPSSLDEIQPLLEHTQEIPAMYNKRLKVDIRRIRNNLIDLKNIFETAKSEDADSGSGGTAAGEEDGGSWMEEKPFKDEFGARLFATRALTPDMIISGLQMFGVSLIGPLSLREMALRANGPGDILEKVEALRNGGIALGESVFTRLVQKLAAENREITLHDLLRSDQHLDVLENAALQESLLVSHYMARDWRQYNLTLAVLGNISKDDPELRNVHFRTYIAAEEWSAALATVDDIHRAGKMLSNKSISYMIDSILTTRVRGKAPNPKRRNNPVNEEAFLIQILQQVARFGGQVDADLWIEMLKRLGMAKFCRWDEIRELALWLVRHYRTREHSLILYSTSEPRRSVENGPITEYKGTLHRIFNPRIQMALVAWGFKMRVSTTKRKRYRVPGLEGDDLVPWVRGLVLLRDLHRRGVWVYPGMVRRACRQRLSILFGRPRYSNRRWNRLLRRENPYTASRVVGDLIKAWGPSLFQGQEKNDMLGLLNPPSTGLSLRRTRANQLWTAGFHVWP